MKNAIRRNITLCSSETKKVFFRPTLKEVEKLDVEIPEMQRFVEFWEGIWEKKEPTPNMRRMEEMKAELGETANLVSEFAITDENIKKEIAKQKNWKKQGIDGIQNF